jgi:hypothetical protein
MPVTPDDVVKLGFSDIDVDGTLVRITPWADVTYKTRPIEPGRWFNYTVGNESIGMVQFTDGDYWAYEHFAVGVGPGHIVPDLGGAARVLVFHQHFGHAD